MAGTVLVAAIALSGCMKAAKVDGHYLLSLDLIYEGRRLALSLPFHCERRNLGLSKDAQIVAAPHPYLYGELPDGSGLAIGTPQICEPHDAPSVGLERPPNNGPAVGRILIPPVAWLDSLDTPKVMEQWASAEAMRQSSGRLVVLSADVRPMQGPATVPRVPDEDWSRIPGALAGERLCGIAFVSLPSPMPAGFTPSRFDGVYISPRAKNHILEPQFGTPGIAYNPLEFAGKAHKSASHQRVQELSTMMERAATVQALSYSPSGGWVLDSARTTPGLYRSYRLTRREGEQRRQFRIDDKELPLTPFRQLWLEDAQLLLTPIGWCPHWREKENIDAD